MAKVNKFFFNKITLLFILPLVLVPFLWFKNGLLIAGGDDYVLLDPGAFTSSFIYTWNFKIANAGAAVFSLPKLIPLLFFWTFFESMGLSLLLIERLWIILLFFLPALTMYYLMSQISNRPWAKIVAPIFYVFNLFLVVAGPFQTNIQPVVIALPLIFAFWIKGLNNQKESFLKYAILIGLSSLIYAGSNINPPTVAIIPMTLFLYLLFYLVTTKLRNWWRSFKFVTATIGAWFFFNAWWLISFFGGFSHEEATARRIALFAPIATTGLTDFFRLLGSWAWRAGNYKMPYFSYAHNYDEPFLLIITFLIPLLAFGAIFLKPKDRNITFFSLLALVGIFLAKGTAIPFGFVYKLLYEHLPGFWVFREPFAKFTPVTMLAYAVLLGFSADLLYQKVKKRFFLAFLIPIAAIGIILRTAFPMFTGEIVWDKWNASQRSFYVKVPQYWQDLKEYLLNKHLEQERLLTFPASFYGMAYNWPNGASLGDEAALILLPNPILRNASLFSDKTNVIVNKLFSKLSDKNFKIKNFLGLLNVKYILQENDVDWRYYGGIMLPPSQSNQVLRNFGFTKIAEFGKFTPDYLAQIPNDEPNKDLHDELYKELTNRPALALYQMEEKYFLPLFYLPQKIIYSNENIENLPDVVSSDNWEKTLGVYFDSADRSIGFTSSDLTGWKDKADEVFIKPRLKEGVGIVDHLRKIEDFKIKISPAYAKHQPGDFLYPLVLKKEQLGEWLVRKNKEKLLEKKLFYAGKRISELKKFNIETMDENLIRKVLALHEKKMEEAVDLVIKMKVKDQQAQEVKEEMAVRLRTYWEIYKEDLENTFDIFSSKKKRGEFLTLIGEIFNRLDDKITPLEKNFDWQKLEYGFEIPRDGRYKFDVKVQDVNELEGWQIELGGEIVNFRNKNIGEEGWVTLGEKDFKAGSHKLVLRLLKPENLVSDNWQQIKRAEIGKESFSSFSQGFFSDAQSLVFQKVNNWQPGQLYYLGINYKTEGDGWLIGALEERPKRNEEEDDKSGGRFFEKVLKSRKTDKLNGWKRFETLMSSTSDSLGAKVYLRALSGYNQFAKMNFKDLVVVKILQPTIILRSSSKPISANAVLSTPQINFVKINPTKYKVKVEGVRDSYILAFSETFHPGWKAYIGKKPLAEEKHLLINGYANSWYITPADSHNQENYEIIIEFWPQRLFYLGLAVSLITLLSGLGYLGYSLFKGKA